MTTSGVDKQEAEAENHIRRSVATTAPLVKSARDQAEPPRLDKEVMNDGNGTHLAAVGAISTVVPDRHAAGEPLGKLATGTAELITGRREATAPHRNVDRPIDAGIAPA